jgi:hypothetical protein
MRRFLLWQIYMHYIADYFIRTIYFCSSETEKFLKVINKKLQYRALKYELVAKCVFNGVELRARIYTCLWLMHLLGIHSLLAKCSEILRTKSGSQRGTKYAVLAYCKASTSLLLLGT